MILKVLLLMVTINSFLYLSGYTLFDNDIMDQLVDINEGAEQIQGYGGDLSDSLPADAQASTSLIAESTGFSFFDALNMVWGFLLFMLNLVFAPIGLFVASGMPIALQLLVGLPLGVAYIFGLIVLIRGGGA